MLGSLMLDGGTVPAPRTTVRRCPCRLACDLLQYLVDAGGRGSIPTSTFALGGLAGSKCAAESRGRKSAAELASHA